VTVKGDHPREELDKAKDEARSKGGVIKHEYTLISGFTVEFPDDHVDVLESNDKIHVEKDQEVRTQ
ncbi:hypothetical protein KEM55_003194, partial [Ascosphaera atra]